MPTEKKTVRDNRKATAARPPAPFDQIQRSVRVPTRTKDREEADSGRERRQSAIPVPGDRDSGREEVEEEVEVGGEKAKKQGRCWDATENP